MGTLNKKYRYKIIVLIIIQTFNSIIDLAGLYILYDILEFFTTEKQGLLFNSFQMLNLEPNGLIMLTTVGIIFIIRFISLLWLSYLKSKTLVSISQNVTEDAFKNFAEMDYGTLRSFEVAEILQNIRGETLFFYRFLTALSSIATEVLSISILIIILFTINFKFSLILFIVLGVFLSSFNIILKDKQKYWGKRRHIYETRIIQTIQSYFYGINEIRAHRKDKFASKYFFEENSVKYEIEAKNNFFQEIPKYFIEIILFIGILLSLWWSLNSNLDAGLLIAFLVSGIRIIPGLNRVVGNIQLINLNSSSVQKVKKYLTSSEIRKTSEDRVEYQFIDEIKISKLYFQYIAAQNLLCNISFTIRIGDVLLISGASGSGKTTLINLILGIEKPTDGEITYFHQMEPLKEVKNIRIGYVSQFPFLFSGSILDNVIQGEPLNNNLLFDLMDECGINWLEKDIDYLKSTILTEGGNNLSGGQKQRLALLRALYRRPNLLVLDEFTSSVDQESKLILLKTIRKYSKKCLTLLISHDKETQELATKIISL